MGSKQTGIGLYEFLIECQLQQYYQEIKNDLKVQSVSQLKYVSDEDMIQVGMSRPEIRRLKKFFQKHYPQTYLAKMKKKLRFRRDDGISVTSLSSYTQNAPGRLVKSIAPGRHIIQAESLSMSSTQTLGSGEFGTVQQGVWTSDDGQRTQVAIKCLSQERMENNPVEFLKEAAIMHNVDHEHIVRLYGVVLDTSALMLVTELAPLRSLLECLKEPSHHFSVPTLYDFAVQICDGMQYLESKRLIHRDLAARNILVFSRNKVKISDFGLSRALGVGKDYYQTNFNVNLKLPIAWCAPECINFLRFTSASDVWAYAVTLWEMFSYGFQPWAALTGQQILEAIDEPNYQRLEKPECCPNEIYYQIMLKCWQHDPLNRPAFAQLSHLILECKPEQVQAVRESEAKPRRDFLLYDAGDIITVLDRKPPQAFDDVILWKGVLKCGKSGLFHPANTITYLGSSLPSVKQSQSPFHRNDSRSSSMRAKGRISADMISGPQGDLKHTGHVGPDGQFFGDLTFLGSKCWVPRQIVPPYKPESSSSLDGHQLSAHGSRFNQQSSSSAARILKESHQDISSSDTVPLLASISTDDGSKNTSLAMRRRHMVVSIPGSNYNAGQDQHEYHEISDEENEMIGAVGGCRSAVGHSNPALSSKSQSPLDSPRFEKSFDLEMGPSLIDEVFSALQHDHQQPDEAHNVKNELREMARSKKKFASVKPISSSDRRTLDHAIAIANELASRSMVDLDRSGKNGHTNNSLDDLSSPRTPNSPSHRRKFSFILGSGKNSDRERRNYSQEAASIPDIQSTLTEEAKEAYNSLVGGGEANNCFGFLTPSYENKSISFHYPEKCSSLSKKTDFFFEPESNNTFNNGPLSLTEIPINSSSASMTPTATCASNSASLKPHNRSLSLSKSETGEDNCGAAVNNTNEVVEDEEVDGNPLRLLRQNKQAMMTNVLPLPPRKGNSSSSNQSTLSSTSRHQRKHPLLIPNRISSMPSSDPGSTNTVREPPVPPAKPIRLQNLTDILTKDQDRSRDQTNPLGEVSSSEVSQENNNKQEPLPHIASNTITTTTADAEKPEARHSDVNRINIGSSSIISNLTRHGGITGRRTLEQPVLLYENVDSGSGDRDSDIISLKSSNNLEECATSNIIREDVPLISSGRSSSESSSVANFNRMSSSVKKDVGISSFRSCQGSSTDQNPAFEIESDEFCSTTTTTSSPNRSSSTFTEEENKIIPNINTSSSVPVVAAATVPTPLGQKLPRLNEKVQFPGGYSIKIKTLQRILGPSASEEDCTWALGATDADSAHAVKLLRLKSLLPEYLLKDQVQLVSVLEMSHWDITRACSFLLNNPNNKSSSTTRGKLRAGNTSFDSTFRTPTLSALERTDTSERNTDSVNNNNLTSGEGPNNNRSYIRPTHV